MTPVRLVEKNQDAKQCHIEPKRCFLTAPLMRLPHQEPFTAYYHKAEKPN